MLHHSVPFVPFLSCRNSSLALQQKRGPATTTTCPFHAAKHAPCIPPTTRSNKFQRAGFGFPYLYDEAQDVAKAYGAVCTPDIYLYDADRKLQYHGQFDDSRPSNGRPVTGAHYALNLKCE